MEASPNHVSSGMVTQEDDRSRRSFRQWAIESLENRTLLSSHAEPALPAPVTSLSADMVALLRNSARGALRHALDPLANNLTAGVPHSWYGSGKWRAQVNGAWVEQPGDLPRWQGSHVVPNEWTLWFGTLAIGYRDGFVDYLPVGERYGRTWGNILKGLRTMRSLQLSGDLEKYSADRTFYRAYWTFVADRDRLPQEIAREPGNDKQSADDNALTWLNLLQLEGLAQDPHVVLPQADRQEALGLCRSIRADINLRHFFDGHRIVMEWANGQPSTLSFDRIGTEGGPILVAMLLSGAISSAEFSAMGSTMAVSDVEWNSARGLIRIENPSEHAAQYMAGTWGFHGLPLTQSDVPGMRFFDATIRPITEVQIDYAKARSFAALGSQVMSAQFRGTSLTWEAGAQTEIIARFAGNERGAVPAYGSTLARATASHAFFVPLMRWQELQQADIDQIFAWMNQYSGFLHSEQFGWEVALPWRPEDTQYSWVSSDSLRNYTDAGRVYDTLNGAYVVRSVHDALHVGRTLAQLSPERQRMGVAAVALLDQMPLPNDLALPVSVAGTEGDDVISVIARNGFCEVRVNSVLQTRALSSVSEIVVTAGSGNDRITVEVDALPVTLLGGAGNDTLQGSAGGGFLDAGSGSDRVVGMGGPDIIWGGAGDDWIAGMDGADTIDGGGGNDSVYGGMGADRILLGDGNDLCYAGRDNDSVWGGYGRDSIVGDGGVDYVYGENDFDNVNGGGDNDLVYGGPGCDMVVGMDGNDVLYAGADSDRLFGGPGADILFGDGGNDTLQGGYGNDTLKGGAGNDIMTGEGEDDWIWSNGDGAKDIVRGDVGFDHVRRDVLDQVLDAVEDSVLV